MRVSFKSSLNELFVNGMLDLFNISKYFKIWRTYRNYSGVLFILLNSAFANAITSVTISDEVLGNNLTGRTTTALLDDA